MNRKLKEHDKATRLILEGKYGYSNDNDVVKVCKYCNEVLKHKTEDYAKGYHIDACKVIIGEVQKLIEKLENDENLDSDRIKLINILSDGVITGEVNRAFAKKVDKKFRLNIF